MNGIISTEVLKTVNTIDVTYFQEEDIIRLTDTCYAGIIGNTNESVAVITKVTEDMLYISTVEGIRYCVNADELAAGICVITKLNLI